MSTILGQSDVSLKATLLCSITARKYLHLHFSSNSQFDLFSNGLFNHTVLTKSRKPAKPSPNLRQLYLRNSVQSLAQLAYHFFIKCKNRLFPRAWDCCHHGPAKIKSRHNRKTADSSATKPSFFLFYCSFSVFFSFILCFS